MKFLSRWSAVAMILLALPGMASADKTPSTGELLVKINLNGPETADQQAYLGLSGSDIFEPTNIRGKLLIIEIFSMYCPHCQREAPAVNRLFEAIEASEALRGQVKLIGIGVGNSMYEVDHFRKHYQIAFPLFPDEDFIIHKALGEVRTPFFVIVRIGPKDNGKILWTGAGNMDPLKSYMDRLKHLIKER